MRHQLVTPQQQDIYDYWRSLCDENRHTEGLPSRYDIDPVRLHRQLPFVTLSERGADGAFYLRLAGTGFWNFFGSEITGARIDELPLGAGCAYWNRVLAHVETTGQPMAGTTRPFTPRGADLRQFWVRLPLADGVILGFDQYLAGATRRPSRLMRPTFGGGIPMLSGA